MIDFFVNPLPLKIAKKKKIHECCSCITYLIHAITDYKDLTSHGEIQSTRSVAVIKHKAQVA